MEEVWKEIKGFEGKYQVSNLGRIKSLPRFIEKSTGNFISKEKILKPSKAYAGRLQVVLRKDNISKTYPIHKLVAIAFIDHTPCGYGEIVDHIDNDYTNNKADNLQLITQRENTSKDRNGYSSKYVGVDWNKTRKLWRSRIWINGKHFQLGHYEKELDAHNAYKEKLKEVLC